ncbi:MAG: 1-acyl-sn-glycerol-3-phosphate acyltransferase [Spirochaetales bacterium]|nr:1-acyl-sn-glycerol-3-phosphate acyltransferase [Spirochaetales bacterium]
MRITDYIDQIKSLTENLKGRDYGFRPDNVYQEGIPENREIIGQMVDPLMLPGSSIENKEALIDLHKKSSDGKACLLLVEHYSNFDYPCLVRLVEKDKDLGIPVASAFLPLQGMKLSEGNPITAAFSNSYDTIVIYPSRSIDKVQDEAERKKIRDISVPINIAAIKELTKRKHAGHIITVFPAGTRYRPWEPESGKGVREIYSYLKTFDYLCFLAINGNTLVPCREEVMEQDEPRQDVMTFTFSDVVDSKTFRQKAAAEVTPDMDVRQHTVDKVMETLFAMHDRNEPARLEKLKALGINNQE